jgi:hypothetical protein
VEENISNCFSNNLRVEVAIGNEGDSLESKNILIYRHKIFTNFEVKRKEREDEQYYQFLIRPWVGSMNFTID